ncbi:MAG: efflux RND transporter periplasmic adaptor subunit [Candidatus Aminicenantia bacterium]
MRKFFIIGIVVIIVFLIVFFNLRSSKKAGISCETEKVKKDELISKVSASGEVKPKKYVNISSNIPGMIEKIYVKEGEIVEAGQILIKLDSAQYEASVERDKAYIASLEEELKNADVNLKKSESSYKRSIELHKEELISDEALENAKSQYEMALSQRNSLLHKIAQAKASLQSTMDSLNKTIILSPIEGVVTSLKVEEGEVAVVGTMNNPGTILLTIADLSVMEVEIDVDETDVINVKPGQMAEVKVDAIPEKVIVGEVTEVGSSAKQSSALLSSSTSSKEAKDFKVVVTLKNPPPELKPGLSASADIIVAKKESVLKVPISCLVVRESEDKKEEEGVFVVKDGKAQFKKIVKGITGEMEIEVLSGLNEGDEIIVGPYKALRTIKDGDFVKVAKKK